MQRPKLLLPSALQSCAFVERVAGAAQLLTHPAAASYVQNPISVYFCANSGGTGGGVARCIAEVTNTPWGERVTFAFDPAGDTVAKSLHVSPLMDMQGLWCDLVYFFVQLIQKLEG